MFSTFVYIFFVLLLEVGHGVVSYLADERVLMDRTMVEKFFRKTVDKFVYRFNIKSGVQEGNGSASGVVAYNPKTFRLKSLKMTVVGSRSVAPNGGGVCYIYISLNTTI